VLTVSKLLIFVLIVEVFGIFILGLETKTTGFEAPYLLFPSQDILITALKGKFFFLILGSDFIVLKVHLYLFKFVFDFHLFSGKGDEGAFFPLS